MSDLLNHALILFVDCRKKQTCSQSSFAMLPVYKQGVREWDGDCDCSRGWETEVADDKWRAAVINRGMSDWRILLSDDTSLTQTSSSLCSLVPHFSRLQTHDTRFFVI